MMVAPGIRRGRREQEDGGQNLTRRKEEGKIQPVTNITRDAGRRKITFRDVPPFS